MNPGVPKLYGGDQKNIISDPSKLCVWGTRNMIPGTRNTMSGDPELYCVSRKYHFEEPKPVSQIPQKTNSGYPNWGSAFMTEPPHKKSSKSWGGGARQLEVKSRGARQLDDVLWGLRHNSAAPVRGPKWPTRTGTCTRTCTFPKKK